MVVSGWMGYGESARFYDLFDRKDNIGFFLEHATRHREILDIGAGTGRIAVPMAEHGVAVWAVEPSAAMRSEFQRKLDERPELRERITLLEGSARSFNCGRVFPACMMSGTFDHLLDVDEREEALKNIGRHLAEGGALVFDVFPGLMSDAPLAPAGSIEVGGKEIRRFVGGRVLPDGLKETRLVFEVYEDAALEERVEERSLVGLVGRHEIHRLLRATGFVVRHEWGSYGRVPYREGDGLLIVESEKRSGE
jgi:SAM-dependent methyltransferase